jgi:CheY-like chemotaxis protein/HPt (histidine-containing phosphotransfer) domain-containing protein
VDDHPVNRQVLLHQLEMLGMEADSAGDGSDALALWQPGRYAAVLTDLHMPRMDGYSLTASIRAQEAALGMPGTPIVAVTANAMRGEEERCLEAGMSGYLAKPVTVARLRDTLQRWMPLAPADGVGVLPGPSFDRASLRIWMGQDESAINLLLASFLDSVHEARREIEAALAADDLPKLGLAAHKLRGAALGVGARALAEIAARLQAAVRAGDRSNCGEGLDALGGEIRRVAAEISSELPIAV